MPKEYINDSHIRNLLHRNENKDIKAGQSVFFDQFTYQRIPKFIVNFVMRYQEVKGRGESILVEELQHLQEPQINRSILSIFFNWGQYMHSRPKTLMFLNSSQDSSGNKESPNLFRKEPPYRGGQPGEVFIDSDGEEYDRNGYW
ncbi:hypothetical protein L3V79_02520 [Thiotrichales bacterium 19S9-12]|nr:hypothetical protein [Thiotrichales bacterium 19S9-11]MCF6811232.1 hypothetical protein [Thiotrichales bacterium 19S9-12]